MDKIYIDALRDAGLYDKVAGGAILLPVKSVGVMGDERTYESLRRTACRDFDRRHDRRLGAPALRVPCQCVERHHQ